MSTLPAYPAALNATAKLALQLLLQLPGTGEKENPYPVSKILKTIMKKSIKKSTGRSRLAQKPTTLVKKNIKPVKKSAAPAKIKIGAAAEPPATFISAKIDIGFGQHLYLRGEGPGLSWQHGLAMDCVGANLWTITIKNAADPVVFKLLVNDVTWSHGHDFITAPGQSITVVPTF